MESAQLQGWADSFCKRRINLLIINTICDYIRNYLIINTMKNSIFTHF